MSSSLSRNSNVRKSFRLEITLEKSYVETSQFLHSPEETLKPDLRTSSEREFTNIKTWTSDPKLVKDAPSCVVTKKSSSSGNIAKSLLSSKGKKKNKKQSDKTMNHTVGGNGASSSQKTKTGPVTKIKTVIRSTKETIVEKLPGGLSKNSSGWLHRSRPKSMGASQRYSVHCNGNIHQRDLSLSPPRERKIAAKVDRSRSFNSKTRVNVDGFVAKRCEVWERKSRDSSPERSIILPLELPSSESDRKSLIKKRTAMLFEPKAPESSLPNKKQLLLDLNGRTSKGGIPCQSKPPKPQLKPKRVNLFKRGLPVKPTGAHQKEAAVPEPVVIHGPCSPTSEQVLNGDRSTMGKTCSVHQEGSVIEDDYGIDVLKTGYDQYTSCNGVASSSPKHSSIKDRSPDKRSAKYEKENQNVVLPIASKHRTTNSSSKTQEAVQSNGCVPNGVLTERLDKNVSNYELPSKYGEVAKRQTVATLNGIKLVDSVIEGTEDIKKAGQIVLTDHAKIDDDVFENIEVVDKRETVVTLNGVQLVEAEKDGHYFINIVNRVQGELEELSRRADIDLESDLPEEASGRVRAVIGKTNLLTTKKFKQFRGLCNENNHPMNESSKVPTSEDLAGFWDMVMLQVDDVKMMFQELDMMRKNGWQSPKRPSQVKPPEVRTPSGKIRTKTRPKATTPNTKNSLKDAERAAKAKQQREEARRRLLAAKKAMRRRTLSGSLSDDGGVEIYC